MDVARLYAIGSGFVLGLAPVVFVALFFIVAPYGRHGRGGWGPTLPARWAWVLMEFLSPLGFAAVYAPGPQAGAAASLVFLGLWQAHYLQRTFVYPLLLGGRPRPVPVAVVAMGMVFNGLNATINALAVAHVVDYGPGWFADPRFGLGVALFVAGYAINRHADWTLRSLRAPGETGYKIPRGGLYRWVSCPNYLGELIEWTGWAIATWSLAGLAFALFTAANLAPRAIAHHRWYRQTFADYPPERKALIPGVV